MPSVRYDVSTAGLIDCSYCRKAAFAEPSGETGTASQCLASTAPTESHGFVKAVVTTVLALIHRPTIAMLPTIRFRSTRIHAHDVAINATACPADAKEIEPKAKYIRAVVVRHRSSHPLVKVSPIRTQRVRRCDTLRGGPDKRRPT